MYELRQNRGVDAVGENIHRHVFLRLSFGMLQTKQPPVIQRKIDHLVGFHRRIANVLSIDFDQFPPVMYTTVSRYRRQYFYFSQLPCPLGSYTPASMLHPHFTIPLHGLLLYDQI